MPTLKTYLRDLKRDIGSRYDINTFSNTIVVRDLKRVITGDEVIKVCDKLKNGWRLNTCLSHSIFFETASIEAEKEKYYRIRNLKELL